MKTKLCSVLLLLFSVFELNLCLIQVDRRCRITITDPSVKDFERFTIPVKILSGFSQVLILEDRTFPYCKYAAKEVRYLKEDANLPARSSTTDANTKEETYSVNG